MMDISDGVYFFLMALAIVFLLGIIRGIIEAFRK